MSKSQTLEVIQQEITLDVIKAISPQEEPFAKMILESIKTEKQSHRSERLSGLSFSENDLALLMTPDIWKIAGDMVTYAVKSIFDGSLDLLKKRIEDSRTAKSKSVLQPLAINIEDLRNSVRLAARRIGLDAKTTELICDATVGNFVLKIGAKAR